MNCMHQKVASASSQLIKCILYLCTSRLLWIQRTNELGRCLMRIHLCGFWKWCVLHLHVYSDAWSPPASQFTSGPTSVEVRRHHKLLCCMSTRMNRTLVISYCVSRRVSCRCVWAWLTIVISCCFASTTLSRSPNMQNHLISSSNHGSWLQRSGNSTWEKKKHWTDTETLPAFFFFGIRTGRVRNGTYPNPPVCQPMLL